MAGVLGRHVGGIASLRQLAADYPEALHFELLKLGLRLDDLGSRRLSWFDLKAVVASLPPGSALHRARDGDEAVWDLHAQLLAGALDALNAANWQRAGDQNAARPQPVRRATAVKQVAPLTTETRAALNQRLGGAFLRGG